jgi:hypothetical protein
MFVIGGSGFAVTSAMSAAQEGAVRRTSGKRKDTEYGTWIMNSMQLGIEETRECKKSNYAGRACIYDK